MDTTRLELSAITPGIEYHGAAWVRSREERSTRAGKAYLIITLGNQTGDCTARVWSESVEEWAGIEAGSAVHVRARGKAGYNGGQPEIEINAVQRLDDSHPVRQEINPSCPIPAEELQRRLERTIRLIRRPRARELVRLCLDAVSRDRYLAAPAAVGHHHAYIGGLVQHSLEVARIAMAIADAGDFAELVDRDLLITGALLHDIGKVGDARGGEYEWEGTPIAISRLGRLRSHVARGAEIVAEATRDALAEGRVDPTEVLHLQHVIESHHGQREWGSPTAPRTLEAQTIHISDNASAKLTALARDLFSADPDEDYWVDPSGWRREPIWHISAELAATEITVSAAADMEQTVNDAPAPPQSAEPLARTEGDDDWTPPIIELTRSMTMYLTWLVGRDLQRWTPSRRVRMARDEAVAFHSFLGDFLPDTDEDSREAEQPRPTLKVI